eukprot:350792-Chlamydomonas_euryale.AAC.6
MSVQHGSMEAGVRQQLVCMQPERGGRIVADKLADVAQGVRTYPHRLLERAHYDLFLQVSHNPPLVVLGCCRHSGRPKAADGTPAKKDTLQNIEETRHHMTNAFCCREFVVNIISDWFVEAANYTCAPFSRGVHEMLLSGLTGAPSSVVAPPRVAEAAVSLECRLEKVVEFEDRCAEGDSCPGTLSRLNCCIPIAMLRSAGTPTVSVVFGRVVMIHANEGVLEASPTGKV